MRSDLAILRGLVAPARRTQALRLMLLMTASAATESLGVMLLVPLLAALEPDGAGAAATWLKLRGLMPTLGSALLLFVGLIALRAAINFARGRAALRFELGVVGDLRSRAWDALLGADWRALAGMRRSDSTSLLITGIDRVGYGLAQAVQGLAVLVTLCGLGLAGLLVAPAITFLGLVGGLLVLLAYRSLRRRAARLGQHLDASYAAMQGSVTDTLGAMRTVKSLGAEDRARTATQQSFAELVRARLGFQRGLALGQAALQVGGGAVLALLVWAAVTRWHFGAAVILPVVALFARALPLVGTLQESWQNFAYTRPAVEAVNALIERAEAVPEMHVPGGVAPSLTESIRLEGAGVQFEGTAQPALSGIDLHIPARTVTALTGASGAGKSTLADVIGGLLSPDQGRMTIDGMGITPDLRRDWRRRVAYVHQDAVFFAGSLRDNLTAGRAADDAALEAALNAAAADFALQVPDGLDTRIGDGGRVLSGGEMQRLSLARALLRGPDLLILDEPTSALDPESESRIAEAIAGLKGRMTILIVAHRGALLALADQTVKLDAGRTVASGG